MKKIFTKLTVLLALIGLSFTSAKAQFVTISDANFAAWLTTNYPTCMIGNQMDTTCSAIVNETSITLPFVSINSFDSLTNVSAIQYFDNLQRFILPNNYVQTLERFPAGLKKINIFYNGISVLPPLPPLLDTLILNGLAQSNNIFFMSFPASLTHIDLMNNNLIGIQTLMPPNLVTLNISGNPFANSYFAGLMDVLPSTLLNLSFVNCGVTALTQLPPNLVSLYCSDNQIYNLPNLPSSLMFLYCENNNLGQLPPLPANLFNLSAAYNNLNSLPDTLPQNLVVLAVGSNNIDSIPDLPQSLIHLSVDGNPLTELPNNFASLYNFQYLSCANCSLTSLPAVPNTSYLNCSNNQITCIGELSQNLVSTQILDLSNNPFVCVPNYVQAMDSVFVAAHPLCVLGDTVNNPFNCGIAKGIAGTVYKDNNLNCSFENGDKILKNIKINFFDPINSVFSSTFSGLSGVYFNTLNPSVYLLSLDTLNNDYTYSCQFPGLDTMVTLTVAEPLAEQVNFGVECNTGFDVGVKSINLISGIPFPGQLQTINIAAGDLSQWYNLNCAQSISGQVTITLNGPVTLSSIAANSLTPSNVAGNVLTYNIADFGLVDIDSAFILNLLTDTTAQSGDQICIQASVTTTSVDNYPMNNDYTQCYPAVNSYDPNYKEVYPTNVAPGFQDWLTYTIHFQNLGNAPAYNIRLLDTLDTNLNLSTFEIIGYSHANNTILNGNILTVRFPNIMLPDSASNPSGSQGFVQYRIKPKANLLVGTQIENTAHIYFDFNPAIVTNTTVNNFVTTVGNTTLPQASRFSFYPNPSTGIFTISAKANIEVFNLIGDLIISENNATSIDLTAAPKGMYFVKLNGGNIEKLIKN
jgi:uncharacterized repeat protein (TIGR01451 family)